MMNTQVERLIVIMLGITYLPLIFTLPWMVSLYVAAVVALRFRYPINRSGWRHLSLRVAFAVASIIIIAAQARHYSGMASGVGFLACMTSLKLLEAKNQRDFYILVFLNYFISASYYIFYQNPGMTLYGLLLIILNTGALQAVTSNRLPSPRIAFKISLSAWALGLPLAFVLFYLFPRLDSPLWSVMSDRSQATTGLSNELNPGDISRLSRSDAVAFRVEFEGQAPEQSALYWRGPVMDTYNGRTWTPGFTSESGDISPPLVGNTGAINYRIYLEPHQRNWVFGLETPNIIPNQLRMTSSYQLVSKEPITRTKLFALQSVPGDTIAATLSESERVRYTRLPPNAHPKTRALIEAWKTETANHQTLIRRALSWFREQDFYYTLEPPVLKVDVVDQFLFDSRKGFCGHYANAFSVMMRMAGIPTRVVTGYQGGKLHPSGEYMIVRQSDAHAWTEVWLEGIGWQRVDPTAYIAPNRVLQGLDAAVNEEELVPGLARINLSWLQNLRLRIDYLDAMWNRWVVAYNQNTQQQLLDKLGLDHWFKGVGVMLGTCLALIGLSALVVLRPKRTVQGDHTSRTYKRWLRSLAKNGVTLHPTLGPNELMHTAQKQLPEHAQTIEKISTTYIGLRFSRSAGGISDKDFTRLVDRGIKQIKKRS